MRATIDRRAVLGAALGAAAAGVLPVARAAERLQSQPLADGLVLIGGAGANVLVLGGEEGQLLVDTGAAGQARALRTLLATLPGKRVHTVINTHWHRAQCGANEAFGKAGATIVAHAKTRQRLSADLWQPESGSYLAALPKAAWPTKTFHGKESLTFAGQPVECGYLVEAHTDGDIYAWFPQANVLAVGDVLAAPDQDPELDWYGGGWIGGRVDGLAQLLKIARPDTRIVPSQGPVTTRAALQAEHDMLAKLFDQLAGQVRKGFTTQDMLASKVLDSTGRAWKDGGRFLYAAHKGLWAHHNTLSHDIV